MAQESSSHTLESAPLIDEIATTNQISVPWEELRKALLERLDRVLESNQLAYTEATVSNPLTIALSAVPPAPTAVPSKMLSSPPSAQPVPVISAKVGAEQEQDAVHVPEHNQESHLVVMSPSLGQGKPSKLLSQDQSQGSNASVIVGAGEQGQNAATSTGIIAEEMSDKSDLEQPSGEDTKRTQEDAYPATPAVFGDESDDEKGLSTGSIVDTNHNASQLNLQPAPTSQSDITLHRMVPMSKDTLLLETPGGYRERIIALINAFTSAPFTIQRVCELLANPSEHHRNLIKYLRAVEKVLTITSSINEFSNPAYIGRSALDGEVEENSDAEEKSEPETAVNGNYPMSTTTAFTLIRPNETINSSDEDQDIETGDSSTSGTMAFSDGKGLDDNRAKKEDGSMEVEKPAGDGAGNGADMEVDPASSMEGVENQSGELQTDGGEEDADGDSSMEEE
ncbi:protein phosphatase 4, regulatory subunit 2 [Lunasporangiospora selenospora]|uniref:Protein phosphatase 4, regulatory subunit 2 n=1 Tax=Lunasporangiospora selenospora TaxID=979761 RepID=A0A9P6FW11_9FUNG|nr:protein phosphatase 4, regulatory subunit 2 [Lunasporangiospora selenospora]